MEAETSILWGKSDPHKSNSNLYSYFLSFFFFRIPNRVAKKLTQIQRRFLWGGSLDQKKIAWVKWDYWLMEQEPLREKYPRLYNISCQQQKLIQDMGCQSANVWEWKLEWRRHLFEWRSQFLCVCVCAEA